MPHTGVDAVPVACQVVQAFQSILSRNCAPLDAAVLSVTMIHAGQARNVTPSVCQIEGTVRAFRSEVVDLIERRMRSLAQHTCAAHGAGCDFEFLRRAPAVVNHRFEAEFASRVMTDLVGPQRVMVQEPAMPSEDFAYMLQAKAGCYAFIGNGDGEHRAVAHGLGPCMVHNPSYDFNDALLPVGAAYWVALAQAWLAQAPQGPAR